MPEPPVLRRWLHRQIPTDEMFEEKLHEDRMAPEWWANGPGDRYEEHTHDYHKALYCAEGSITFTLTPTGEELELYPGDRLDLPPGWPHSAVVGTAGVRCVEGHR